MTAYHSCDNTAQHSPCHPAVQGDTHTENFPERQQVASRDDCKPVLGNTAGSFLSLTARLLGAAVAVFAVGPLGALLSLPPVPPLLLLTAEPQQQTDDSLLVVTLPAALAAVFPHDQ